MKNRLRILCRNPRFVVGAVLFCGLVGTAFLFPVLSGRDPMSTTGMLYSAPSMDAWLGTDNFGRDVFTELIFGLRTSLIVGLLAGTVATVVGTGIGAAAGYAGGIPDHILTMITNLFLVIPSFVILILVSVSLPTRSVWLVGLVIGCTSWPWTARAVRAQAASLRDRDHVMLARLNADGPVRLILRQILPYLLSYVFMAFVLQIGSGILSEAGISMLGLGPYNTVSLGTMLNWALLYESVRTGAWWAFLPPTLTIATVSFSLMAMNTAMDEIFNPRLRKS